MHCDALKERGAIALSRNVSFVLLEPQLGECVLAFLFSFFLSLFSSESPALKKAKPTVKRAQPALKH